MGSRFPSDFERHAAYVFQELDYVLGCLSDEVSNAIARGDQLDPADVSKFVRALSHHKTHLLDLTQTAAHLSDSTHSKAKRQA
ncbi:MAG: hypothetical protein WC655_22355 [Candidatus Hydrogenedentales bacterium]